MGGVVRAVERVVENVTNVVSKAVDAALADPIGTIAKVVAVGTGNAYLLPYISAASVVAHGGNFEDAVKSGALTWVAQGVTNYVADQLSSDTTLAIKNMADQNGGLVPSTVTADVMNAANATTDPIAALNAAAGWTNADINYLQTIGYTGTVVDPSSGIRATVKEIADKGYTNVEQYAEGSAGGFTDAAQFNKATSAGYDTAADYAKGTLEGFDNANLYKQATAKGFDNYGDYSKALNLGFPDATALKQADAGGFKNEWELQQAQKGNFTNRDDWSKATEKGITNAKDYADYVANAPAVPVIDTYRMYDPANNSLNLGTNTAYADGSQVWKSADGTTTYKLDAGSNDWKLTSGKAFVPEGSIHTVDEVGNRIFKDPAGNIYDNSGKLIKAVETAPTPTPAPTPAPAPAPAPIQPTPGPAPTPTLTPDQYQTLQQTAYGQANGIDANGVNQYLKQGYSLDQIKASMEANPNGGWGRSLMNGDLGAPGAVPTPAPTPGPVEPTPTPTPTPVPGPTPIPPGAQPVQYGGSTYYYDPASGNVYNANGTVNQLATDSVKETLSRPIQSGPGPVAPVEPPAPVEVGGPINTPPVETQPLPPLEPPVPVVPEPIPQPPVIEQPPVVEPTPVVPEPPANTIPVRLPDGTVGNYDPTTGSVTTDTGTPVATGPVEPGPGTDVAQAPTDTGTQTDAGPAKEDYVKTLGNGLYNADFPPPAGNVPDGSTLASQTDINAGNYTLQPNPDGSYTYLQLPTEAPVIAPVEPVIPPPPAPTPIEVGAPIFNPTPVVPPAPEAPVSGPINTVGGPSGPPQEPIQTQPVAPAPVVTPPIIPPPAPVETQPVAPAPPVATPPPVETISDAILTPPTPQPPAPVETQPVVPTPTPPVATPPIEQPIGSVGGPGGPPQEPVVTSPVQTQPVVPTPQPPVVTPPVVTPPVPEPVVPTPQPPVVTPPVVTPPDYTGPGIGEGAYTDTYGNPVDTSSFSPADMVAALASGMIMTPPKIPTLGYGPLGPINWGVAKPVINPGLNPGYITAGAIKPAYQGTPTQSYYNWGQHPYVSDLAHLTNYNNVPSGPAYGAQYAAGVGPNRLDVNAFTQQLLSPQAQQAAMGTSPIYPIALAQTKG